MLSVLLLSSLHITRFCCLLLSAKYQLLFFYAVIKKKKENKKLHIVLAICDKVGYFAALKIYGIMTSHNI